MTQLTVFLQGTMLQLKTSLSPAEIRKAIYSGRIFEAEAPGMNLGGSKPETVLINPAQVPMISFTEDTAETPNVTQQMLSLAT